MILKAKEKIREVEYFVVDVVAAVSSDSPAQVLRKRYGLSIPTLGRVTGLDRDLLRQLL